MSYLPRLEENERLKARVAELERALRLVLDVVTTNESIFEEWRVEEMDPSDAEYAAMPVRAEIAKDIREAIREALNTPPALPSRDDVAEAIKGVNDPEPPEEGQREPMYRVAPDLAADRVLDLLKEPR